MCASQLSGTTVLFTVLMLVALTQPYLLLMQSAGANTMKKTDWENMDLGGGGGGAKAAEIFK